MEKRLCPECGETIAGRIDKKFCSDLCRNAFNNKVNSDSTNYIRNINNILRKNRRILETLLQGEKTTLPKQKLIDKGFNFKYITNQSITKNNHTYFFCYEYGFLPLENELILIVKKKVD
ncbi:MAG: hypothetical protein MUF75_08695 [Bacteroidia bacterium]|jgi:hypothetical protein|nr:hypothetical protein [Bacteroidia bacterium]